MKEEFKTADRELDDIDMTIDCMGLSRRASRPPPFSSRTAERTSQSGNQSKLPSPSS
ncbi:hypothetical protein BT69DRAFT_1345260, partial [Atractiella rhizophila]